MDTAPNPNPLHHRGGSGTLITSSLNFNGVELQHPQFNTFKLGWTWSLEVWIVSACGLANHVVACFHTVWRVEGRW